MVEAGDSIEITTRVTIILSCDHDEYNSPTKTPTCPPVVETQAGEYKGEL
jgi:hypothetical protein